MWYSISVYVCSNEEVWIKTRRQLKRQTKKEKRSGGKLSKITAI
jgi:hypothetical protein